MQDDKIKPEEAFNNRGFKTKDMEAIYKWKKDPWNHEIEVKKHEFIGSLIQRYMKEGSKTLLDIGCGEGYVLKTLKRIMPDISMRGIDASITALSRAAVTVPGLELINGNIVSVRYPNTDIILASDVFYYVTSEEYPLMIENVIASLSENGILVIIEHVRTTKYSVKAFSPRLSLLVSSRSNEGCDYTYRYLVFRNQVKGRL